MLFITNYFFADGHKRKYRNLILEHRPAKSKCMKIDPFSDPQKAFWTFINVHFDCWQGRKQVKKVQNGWSQMKKLET